MKTYNTEITDIANWFLLKQNTCRQQDARQPNGMFGEKIQKLCYYAEAWCLVLYDQSIAKDAEFHAWMHGPINLTLYRKFMGLKWHKLDNPKETHDHLYEVLCPQQLHVLECVWETYSQYGFDELEMLVHQEEPWLETRKGLSPFDLEDRVISKESMKKYYSKIQTKET